MQSRATTGMHSYLKKIVSLLYYSRFSSFVPTFYLLISFVCLSSYALSHTFISERECTPLQCFYKGCIQRNQKLALSRLMKSRPTVYIAEALYSSAKC
jgi:hypothetical protein